MKNLILIKILLFVFCFGAVAQNIDYEYLNLQDPKSTWKKGKGNIVHAEYILKPKGNFVICDLYLTYIADIPNYSKLTDTLEVQHFFTLPENVLVIDSWLWVEDQIMRANILEREEAFNIYEGIVKRRKDPSILYKNSPTGYEFRIFPIPGQKTRRVKLSFLVPLERTNNLDILKLPVSLINSSRIVPNIKLKIQNGDSNLIYLNNSNQLDNESDSLLGNYISTTLTQDDVLNLKSLDIIFKDKNDLNLHFTLKENSLDEGVYQVSLSPNNSLGISSHPKRNIILVLDHESSYSTLSKIQVKEGIKYFLNKTLLPTDSIQILYNDFESKNVFANFVDVKNNNLNTTIDNLNLGNFSQLYSSLYNAYKLSKTRSNCVVMVFSSSVGFNSSTQSQSIKNDFLYTFKTLPQTFFNDYHNLKATGFFQDNVYYRGNELFYKIMTTNTNGRYTFPKIEFNTLNSWVSSINEISNYFDDLTAFPLEMDIRIKIKNGLTFDNINIKNARSGFMQIGKFKGDLPFEIEATILENNVLFGNNIPIEQPNQSNQTDLFEQIHAGFKIQKLERENLVANKGQAIKLSLNHRVLSRFTAFLALEPNLQEPCFPCVDESSTTSTSDDKDGYSIIGKVYPNPFTEQFIIEIKGKNSLEQIEKVEIINTVGQLQDFTFKSEIRDDIYYLEIDGSRLKPGVYLVKIKIGKQILTYKVIKV